jgi:hypothetical protein
LPPPLPRPLQQSAAFKAAIYGKGWSLKALAERWGMTLDGLLKIARDESRPVHFDDAVHGLKKVGPPIKLRKAWTAILSGQAQPEARTRKPGLRYRGYLNVGSVVAAIKAVGSIAEEGMHGIVVQVRQTEGVEAYRVLFETGELETFDPDLVDEYLQDVGLRKDVLSTYCYIDDESVLREYNSGRFEFY